MRIRARNPLCTEDGTELTRDRRAKLLVLLFYSYTRGSLERAKRCTSMEFLSNSRPRAQRRTLHIKARARARVWSVVNRRVKVARGVYYSPV